jgi:hypothetical protein
MERIEPFVPHRLLDIPRVTGQLIVAGPKTFRRASRKVLQKKSKKEPFANWGQNLQNWSVPMRRIIEADDGYIFVNRDQSGADAKIVAYLCTHGPYRELFLNNIKPHQFLALHLFPNAWKERFGRDKTEVALKTPIKDLTKLDFWKALAKCIKSSDDWEPKYRYYYFGKKTAHAFSYGMMGKRLAMVVMEETQGEVVMNEAKADEWILRCAGFFPEIRGVFQFRVAQAAKIKGQLRNLFGFPFNITAPIKDYDMNDLYSWIPQSTVACLNAEAFIKMQEYIEKENKDWHIMADTHDSITMQAPLGEQEECSEILRKCYEDHEFTSPVDGAKFHMGTEVKCGLNWSNYDEQKNPNGLK